MQGKVKRGLLQFTPRDWTTFNWAALSSFKRFTQVRRRCVVVLAVFALVTAAPVSLSLVGMGLNGVGSNGMTA